MWREKLFLFYGLTIAVAGSSLNEDYIENLYKTHLNAGRISDNIYEDARLDVPELVRKYNYSFEDHSITTDDGYILGIHRIPHGRDNNNDPSVRRPIVFLMHGLLSSSADWVLMGPGCGFAYILAEEGFDVWMGNARGNYYSRQHISLNPDALLSTRFWEFSWDEIGNIDLPTMIDYVLNNTDQERLHYVGHSQGTTSFFVMGALRPEYNQKITSMHAFAPVAYMAHNRNPFFLMIAPFSNSLETLASLIGIGEFLPNNLIMTWAGQQFCMDEVIFQPICSNILFLIGGWSESQQNTTMIPVKFGHTPAGASVRQFAHYGQGISGKRFRRYDHGSRRANRKVYGSRTPPNYDLSKVTAPVFLHYVDHDPLAHVNDVDRLFRELGRPVGKFRVSLPRFSHLDFLWGIDAQELVYDRTINLIKSMEINGLNGLSLNVEVEN
ncbi:lipase 3-like [Achroia grisella]|uniref:lipase 3-like n=1 Tax=Achroia grisella TaxID=688607 RepID=UPI0027D2B411|nr:lipase 3-like [Achroia grisella]